jgi:hypothetical protein
MNFIEKVLKRTTALLPMSKRIRIVKAYNSFKYSKNQERRALRYQELSSSGQIPVPSSVMSDGYLLDTSKAMPYLQELLDVGRIIILENRTASLQRKDFLVNVLEAQDYKKYPAIIDFATSAEMISVVAEYLRHIPVLSVIELWWSGPSADDREVISSQMYHLDNADTTQVKVFVHLNNTTEDMGPFTFLPISASMQVCQKTNYGSVKGVHRLTDGEVFSFVSRDREVKAIVPEGTLAFVDTSKCLHYGSRNVKVGRPIMMIQYVTPCRGDFRTPSLSKFFESSNNELRRLVMDIHA